MPKSSAIISQKVKIMLWRSARGCLPCRYNIWSLYDEGVVVGFDSAPCRGGEGVQGAFLWHPSFLVGWTKEDFCVMNKFSKWTQGEFKCTVLCIISHNQLHSTMGKAIVHNRLNEEEIGNEGEKYKRMRKGNLEKITHISCLLFLIYPT